MLLSVGFVFGLSRVVLAFGFDPMDRLSENCFAWLFCVFVLELLVFSRCCWLVGNTGMHWNSRKDRRLHTNLDSTKSKHAIYTGPKQPEQNVLPQSPVLFI